MGYPPPVQKGPFWPFILAPAAHIVCHRPIENMCVCFLLFNSLKNLLADQVHVGALVLGEKQHPILPYKSDYFRPFQVHLVCMALPMMP
jgi:hypothetical protein